MNRLGGATSPYLLQHAGNPVDWWPWGGEATAEARRRDVPLLISIGYAACHWCHVMAHESFEDAATAAAMNAGFVCVKVDREERPDVDAVYMTATQAMTGQGGWPMTVFATPDGRPFHCGTYFPPTRRGPMPGFRELLAAVGDAWRERREQIEDAGDTIAARLAPAAAPLTGGAPGETELAAALGSLVHDFDPVHAGFGGAPKFPPSMTLLHLLRHQARTDAPQALDMVRRTCRAMALGGIYDQLAGGFARYAVDTTWTVPHFEKMLYDNALLLRVYTLLWKATRSPLARRVARETAEFMLRDLGTAEGGFASALDADTDGVEGLTYVWTPKQLIEVLGEDDGAWAAQLFRVTPAGTFEHGASVLELDWVPGEGSSGADGAVEGAIEGAVEAAAESAVEGPVESAAESAAEGAAEGAGDATAGSAAGTGAESEVARYERIRAALLAARTERPQPHRDDKVVAAWNGLAINGLVEASLAFEEPALLDAARAAGKLLVDVHLRTTGGAGSADGSTAAAASSASTSGVAPIRLARTSRDAIASANPGVLEDYGAVAEGFCLLYSATGERSWLDAAAGLLETVRTQFSSDDGLHDTAADTAPLYFRPSDPTDNATPSGSSAAAAGFAAYAMTAGSLDHLDDADRALGAAARLADRAPRFAGYGLAVAEALLADVPAAFVCPGPFCEAPERP